MQTLRLDLSRSTLLRKTLIADHYLHIDYFEQYRHYSLLVSNNTVC